MVQGESAPSISREANIRPTHRVWTVVWIGLVAGTMDIGENLIFNQMRAVTPKMVFQYIASGLIGTRAIAMGGESVALGVAIHYAIAMTWTVLFYLVSRKLAILTRQAAICGIVYGGVVYVIMNFVVLPLTAIPHSTQAMTLASRINGVLALLFCMGLAVSLLVRKFAPPAAARR
jgi:hypothetical protein